MGKPVFSVCVALVIFAGCSSHPAPRHTCVECDEPIKGKFVEVGRGYFHPDHFRCAYCQELITDERYVPEAGKEYHTSCYAGGIVVCAYCGDPDREDTFVAYEGKSYHSSCVREKVVTCEYCKKVTDEDIFIEHDGKDYHKSCFLKQVMSCAFCKRPIRDETYTSKRGRNYHGACYEEFIALRCALCRERIEGDYFTNYWGAVYHASHRSDSPGCDFCGSLLRVPLEGGVKYDDGRFLCRWCRASAVTTTAGVKELALDVSTRLRRRGIDVDVGALALHLVGAEEMRRLDRYGQHAHVGFTTYNEVPGVPGRTTYDQIDVYILYGMPRVQMIAAISHELTHVWQLLHAELRVNRTLAEGSCEYAAYLVLEEVPGGQSEYLRYTMTADGNNDVYGDAFRRVQKYAEENGVARWLNLLANNGPLPLY